jgi:arylsulfatase A-like enzyme
LVELVDLAPTLLDAVGLAVPDFMQGKSLVPILSGQATPDYHKDSVISEFHDALDLPDATHATMCFDGRYKSIVYHGRNVGEIFDLEKDPGEFQNLWDDVDLKAELLLRHLNAHSAASSAGIPRTGAY